MVTKEQKEILLLIEKELVMNDGLRFNQVLHNLCINEFANKKDPYEKDFLLRDGYNDIDSVVLERIKNRKTIEPKKEIEKEFVSDRKIILNRIKTPDGTILTSYSQHQFVSHKDANGVTYSIDGGNAHLSRMTSVIGAEYEELSINEKHPFKIIRKSLHRGSSGKNRDKPYTFTLLCDMDDEWIKACIVYNKEKGLSNDYSTKLYKKELAYRKRNHMSIISKENN